MDAGFSALLRDLESRRLLDSRLVICGGEFGPTPEINEQAGRFVRLFVNKKEDGNREFMDRQKFDVPRCPFVLLLKPTGEPFDPSGAHSHSLTLRPQLDPLDEGVGMSQQHLRVRRP